MSRGVENSKELVGVVNWSLPGKPTGDETFGLDTGETEGATEKGVEVTDDRSSRVGSASRILFWLDRGEFSNNGARRSERVPAGDFHNSCRGWK